MDNFTLDVAYEGGASGPASADLTINDKNKALIGSATHRSTGDEDDYDSMESIGETFSSSDGRFSSSINVPVWPHGFFDDGRTVYTPLDLDLPYPYFFLPPTGSFSFGDGGLTSNAVFDLSEIKISASVPEVGTWSMLLLGFGMLGTILRSRALHGSVLTEAASRRPLCARY